MELGWRDSNKWRGEEEEQREEVTEPPMPLR